MSNIGSRIRRRMRAMDLADLNAERLALCKAECKARLLKSIRVRTVGEDARNIIGNLKKACAKAWGWRRSVGKQSTVTSVASRRVPLNDLQSAQSGGKQSTADQNR